MTRELPPRKAETFCAYHRVDEPAGRRAIRCPECNHAFQSPQDLVAEFNRGVVNLLNRARSPWQRQLDRVNRVGLVPFCPLCTHDLPDLSHLEGR